MTAAISITFLFVISFVIVRIGAVAMRHTGLPGNVARFQCLSALTGTGFTTRESEMIVNYPVRRRILMALMVLGNLGLISVAATAIVSFVDMDRVPGAVAWQITMIVAAVAFTLVVMTNKTLDRIMCDFIGRLLSKFTSLGNRRFQRLLQIADDVTIAEHIYRGSRKLTFAGLSSEPRQLSILAIKGQSALVSAPFADDTEISTGDILICLGSDAEHEAFEDDLQRFA